jgi:pectin methylesterase-like acyl-CoA thioesterase
MHRVRTRRPLLACAFLVSGLIVGRASAAVQSMYPVNGAADACTDTQLRLTFDASPTIGTTGKIELFDAANDQLVETIDVANVARPRPRATSAATAAASAPTTTPTTTRAARPPLPVAQKTVGGTAFTYYPVRVDGNVAEIEFAAPLAYGKAYYVKIAPGVFKENGEASAGVTDAAAWRFTVRPEPAATGKTRIVVAPDASGDFNTVQGAIDAVPAGNTTPTTIFIKKGHYTDLVNFAGKHALTFLGEDRKQTVLQYANNANFNSGPGDRGVFNVRDARDLTMANLTVRNLTPINGSQAETILIRGKADARTLITNCDFYSTQDTVQVSGQAYFSDCYIEGTVDFIWGSGAAFFENCTIRAMRTPGYYTQVRNRGDARGFVFYRCTFDGAPGVERNVFARIRPSAYGESECVLIECKLGPAVSPRGFLLEGAVPEVPNTRFYEYASTDLDGKSADVSQRVQSRQLKLPEDAELIKNYSSATWVLGGWTPVVAEELK